MAHEMDLEIEESWREGLGFGRTPRHPDDPTLKSTIARRKLRAYEALAAAVSELDSGNPSPDRRAELQRIKSESLAVVIKPKPNPKRQFIKDRCKGICAGIYFVIRPDGLCKIGRSESVETRLVTLQSQNGFTLYVWHIIPSTRQTVCNDEIWFHGAFHPYRVEGEWFDLSPKHLAWVRTLSECPAASPQGYKGESGLRRSKSDGFSFTRELFGGDE